MKTKSSYLGTVVLLAAATVAGCSNGTSTTSVKSPEELVKRGEYLVTIGGCNDCHTPKIMTETGPVFDETRLLAGHTAGMPLPGFPADVIGPDKWGAVTNNELTAWAGPWGMSYAANLTPHNVTGSGAWTAKSFVMAMRNGKHLGNGRPILPPMPWQTIGQCTDDDLEAMFAYMQSLKPIDNLVPQPTPPPGIEHAKAPGGSTTKD